MDVILSSLGRLVTDPSLWVLMLGAIVMGMVLGAVPGIGGRVGIVLAIPFVFNLDLLSGAVFLVAMHAVVHTGGAIPAILIGVPGSGSDAATVCDGFPMTQNGEAGRALGASLAASAVGGVLGAVFLAALMPIARPTILAFGPAEFFFLALFGITLVGAISGGDVNKGVIVGALGLMTSFVGAEAQTGTLRFTLGQAVLGDGIDVVTAVLGIFAVPECLALATRSPMTPTAQTAPARYQFREVLTGIADVARHWGLTLRTSLIGAVIGLIPGLGADVASWMCYGHAAQTSKHPERFGHGAVEGVIGPEAANNSKEGGALLPTLFFGIPGSTGMALMLGALIMLGLQPGPAIATEHLDLVWTLIWTLVISNVVAALMFLGVARWLALVIHVRAGLIVPFVLLFAAIGAYVAGGRHSLIVMAAFGVLGLALTRTGWPRSPFVIGVVLGPIMEVSLHQALTIWGPAFVLRPLALVLAGAIVVSVGVSLRQMRKRTGGHSAAA
jgi:TctA family transporter